MPQSMKLPDPPSDQQIETLLAEAMTPSARLLVPAPAINLLFGLVARLKEQQRRIEVLEGRNHV